MQLVIYTHTTTQHRFLVMLEGLREDFDIPASDRPPGTVVRRSGQIHSRSGALSQVHSRIGDNLPLKKKSSLLKSVKVKCERKEKGSA